VSFPKSKGRRAKYGAAHQSARKAYAARHRPDDPCVRCHRPLGPLTSGLHLDHAEDGSYLGFSHAACNKRAGASKGARMVNARRAFTPLRDW
jgi:hypothetical protein